METKTIEVILSVVLFKENDTTIAYCPALDLYGYGYTESEAKESFDIAFSEFLSYALNKKTLEKELLKLGWVRKSKTSKKLNPPTLVDTLSKNKELQKIFNTSEVIKYNKPVPAFA